MKKAAKAKYTSGQGTYTHTYTHLNTLTQKHITSSTDSVSLCQTMCLTWNSTSLRWRSCQSTVSQAARQRWAQPSVNWLASLKNSCLPWKTWWVTILAKRFGFLQWSLDIDIKWRWMTLVYFLASYKNVAKIWWLYLLQWRLKWLQYGLLGSYSHPSNHEQW